MKNFKGIFTISLDCELYWGMRDKRTITNYADNLEGTPLAIEKILKSFKKYDIHATWAIVGFVLCQDLEDLRSHFPKYLPHYHDNYLNPYSYILEHTIIEKKYHFALESINKIMNIENQEIGMHTLSHYYCLEEGQSKKEFFEDLKMAKEIIDHKLKQKVYSFVFPRNQWNNEYLSALEELNILCYRGNEHNWIYREVNQKSENNFRRALRLMDAYINLSGHNTYSLKDLLPLNKLVNIPSSKFLRPVSEKFSLFENMRLKRIKNSMTYAAKNNELFHLWWHPHNFGKNAETNILFLNEILKHYQMLQLKYGMQSLNMKEVACLLLEHIEINV